MNNDKFETLYDAVKGDLVGWETSVLDAVSTALADLGDEVYSLEWVNKGTQSEPAEAA
jgi:hypothetical protein